MYICIYVYMSANPCLRQGRGGNWDHRRCGTCFCGLAISLLLFASKSNCFLLAFKPTVCQPLNLSKGSWHAQRRRQKAPQGQINALLWAFKPAVCLLGTPNPASNRHPKARSMASYGRSSQGQINALLWAFKPAVCQALNP